MCDLQKEFFRLTGCSKCIQVFGFEVVGASGVAIKFKR